MAEEVPMDLAASTGLIQHVVEPSELRKHTMELAAKLASGPTTHYALVKQAVLNGLTRGPWDSALIEGWGRFKAGATQDIREGTAAFRERRPPQFTGR